MAAELARWLNVGGATLLPGYSVPPLPTATFPAGGGTLLLDYSVPTPFYGWHALI